MRTRSFFPNAFIVPSLFVFLFVLGQSHPVFAAMSFCNKTTGAIESALGYRGDDGDDGGASWVSEGWWRIEPGQCARVYAAPLSQRFYFYYAHALAPSARESVPTEWTGKYVFCTNPKAFRIEGDGNCGKRKFQSLGFQELDVGPNARDYTLNFKDPSARN